MYAQTIRETTLWQRLDSGFTGRDREEAQRLAANLIDICQEASARMVAFANIHPQYTLHNEVHFLKVTHLMGQIIPEATLAQLNPVEIALLILAAFLHDQGMVMDAAELEALQSSDQFRSNRNEWELAHPNVAEIRERLRKPYLSDEEQRRCVQQLAELERAMFSDYLRKRHGGLSAAFVRAQYGQDPRWRVQGVSLAGMVAELCQSHVEPAEQLRRWDCTKRLGNYAVNMPYLGLILRLADVLDFDRDRTPDSLCRTIHFTSDVSVTEWAKHQSVTGQEITAETVAFWMEFTHPAYHRAANEFFGWIDRELVDARLIVGSFPEGVAAKYKLTLPQQVDRHLSAIGYHYEDLEFSLSRDEIIKLLMTDNLYESPSLCIRELLQNALDALRHYRALFRCETGVDWPNGKVEFEHTVDEHGQEVLICRDNGIGMDREIVGKFLTRVGRSYYRSYDFQQEQARFDRIGVNFDPCSRFGIGFMSCFMLGDHIKIWTRRYRGNAGQGEPLVVEINGMGGIVVIRPGQPDQPAGTTVQIQVRRRKPGLQDEEANEPVKLRAVLQTYAVACEFPIEARWKLPGHTGALNLEARVRLVQTHLERLRVKDIWTVEQPLEEISPDLRGMLRASFPVDSEGKLVLENQSVGYSMERFSAANVRLTDGSEQRLGQRYALCLDGILVDGGEGKSVASSAPESLGVLSGCIDVRGRLKPTLLPSRLPPSSAHKDRTWQSLWNMIRRAQGLLWEQVVCSIGTRVPEQTFWELATAHEVDLSGMSAGTTWRYLALPVLTTDGTIEWHRSHTLHGTPTAEILRAIDGMSLSPSLLRDSRRLTRQYANLRFRRHVGNVCIWLSVVNERDGRPMLILAEPEDTGKPLYDHFNLLRWLHHLPFRGSIKSFVAASITESDRMVFNRSHPLMEAAFRAISSGEPSGLEGYAYRVVDCLAYLWPNSGRGTGNRRQQVRRMLGRLFLQTDLSMTPELAPPYRAWDKRRGEIAITSENLAEWANIKVKDE
jgi:hypothetical protein